MTTNRTPGPWHIETTAGGNNGIVGADGSDICKTKADQHDDAVLIVNAVNSYDESLHALRLCEQKLAERQAFIEALWPRINNSRFEAERTQAQLFLMDGNANPARAALAKVQARPAGRLFSDAEAAAIVAGAKGKA